MKYKKVPGNLWVNTKSLPDGFYRIGNTKIWIISGCLMHQKNRHMFHYQLGTGVNILGIPKDEFRAELKLRQTGVWKAINE